MSGHEQAPLTREQVQEQLQADLVELINQAADSGQVTLRGWDGPAPKIDVGLIVSLEWPDEDDQEAGE